MSTLSRHFHEGSGLKPEQRPVTCEHLPPEQGLKLAGETKSCTQRFNIY